jgi:nuclear pore complex protein Nup205
MCCVFLPSLHPLQEQGVVNVSMGQAADPLAMVRVPGRCQALLRLLLDLLLRVRRTQAVRLQLYAALLQYLQFCRYVCQLSILDK